MISTSNPSSTFSAEGDPDNVAVDAIDMLAADHDEVKEMFNDYAELARGTGTDNERADLAEQICMALTVHATLEEELFYPAVRNALGDPDLIETAEQEHAQARDLIEQLQEIGPSDNLFDSTMLQLQVAVERHVQEEEDELFPRVRESHLDVETLGLQMTERKGEVRSQIEQERTDD